MAENVDNSLMLEVLKEVRSDQHEFRREQQEFRKELRDQRMLLLQTVEAVRKLYHCTEENVAIIKREFLNVEARMKAHRDDLELMLKSELLASLTHFQTRIETYVEQRLSHRGE